ncbi:MAG: hypothetical protein IJ736_16710 [Firmicutes bacterium]|nr:hypothetical protein [Bacillota bacterium]
MGLFDGVKKLLGFSSEPIKWMITADDKEYKIETGENINDKIWLYLSDIEERRSELVTLFAPEPINDISFLQTAFNTDGDLYIGAGILSNDDYDRDMICESGKKTKNEVYNTMLAFYKGEFIDISDWDDIIYF